MPLSGEGRVRYLKRNIKRFTLLVMLLAMAFIGSVGGPGYSNAAVLFSTQGYDSMAIAWAISLNGLMLIVCK